MNNDGETIHSEEDRKLVDDFRDRDAKEEDRLAMVNAREQARQFNRDHGDFPESDTDDDYRFKNIDKYLEIELFFGQNFSMIFMTAILMVTRKLLSQKPATRIFLATRIQLC